jgi:hypothetical protein
MINFDQKQIDAETFYSAVSEDNRLRGSNTNLRAAIRNGQTAPESITRPEATIIGYVMGRCD